MYITASPSIARSIIFPPNFSNTTAERIVTKETETSVLPRTLLPPADPSASPFAPLPLPQPPVQLRSPPAELAGTFQEEVFRANCSRNCFHALSAIFHFDSHNFPYKFSPSIFIFVLVGLFSAARRPRLSPLAPVLPRHTDLLSDPPSTHLHPNRSPARGGPTPSVPPRAPEPPLPSRPSLLPNNYTASIPTPVFASAESFATKIHSITHRQQTEMRCACACHAPFGPSLERFRAAAALPAAVLILPTHRLPASILLLHARAQAPRGIVSWGGVVTLVFRGSWPTEAVNPEVVRVPVLTKLSSDSLPRETSYKTSFHILVLPSPGPLPKHQTPPVACVDETGATVERRAVLLEACPGPCLGDWNALTGEN